MEKTNFELQQIENFKGLLLNERALKLIDILSHLDGLKSEKSNLKKLTEKFDWFSSVEKIYGSESINVQMEDDKRLGYLLDLCDLLDTNFINSEDIKNTLLKR